MVSDEMGSATGHECGETSNKVIGFEQHMGGAIGEGTIALSEWRLTCAV